MLFHIDNLGGVGLSPEQEGIEQIPEAWTRVENVEFKQLSAKRAEGNTDVWGTISETYNQIFSWVTGGATKWLGTAASKLYLFESGVHTDKSKVGGYTAGSDVYWTHTAVNGVPVLNNNNGVDNPQQWDSATSLFKDLDNWPASTTCKVMTGFGNFLIALHLTQSGTEYPHKIKWSHPAEPGAVPTSWDHTDNTVDAGERTLGESAHGEGKLIAGLALGKIFIIYKDDAIWGMQYIGGGFIFRTWEIIHGIGTISQHTVVSYGRFHVFLSNDDVMLFDGQNEPTSLMDHKLRTQFNADFDPEYAVKASVTVNSKKSEIWIGIPTTSSAGILTKAYIWNWKTNVWTTRDLQNAVFLSSGLYVDDSADTFDSNPDVTFDAAKGIFDQSFNASVDQSLFISQTAPQIVRVENVWDFSGTGFTATLERTGLAIAGKDRNGAWKVDTTMQKFIRGVHPKISALVPVDFTVYIGTQNRIGDGILWGAGMAFNSGTDEKVNCRVSGKIMSIRFESASTDDWTFHGYALDLEAIGRFD